jgi:hypothetical protein
VFDTTDHHSRMQEIGDEFMDIRNLESHKAPAVSGQ